MTELLSVHCPNCEKGVRVPAAAGGFVAVCPLCQKRFKVPTVGGAAQEPASRTRPAHVQSYGVQGERPAAPPGAAAGAAQWVVCPWCAQQLQADSSFYGRPVACPSCGRQFVIGGQGVAPGSFAVPAPMPPAPPAVQMPTSYATPSGRSESSGAWRDTYERSLRTVWAHTKRFMVLGIVTYMAMLFFLDWSYDLSGLAILLGTGAVPDCPGQAVLGVRIAMAVFALMALVSLVLGLVQVFVLGRQKGLGFCLAVLLLLLLAGLFALLLKDHGQTAVLRQVSRAYYIGIAVSFMGCIFQGLLPKPLAFHRSRR